MAYNRDPMSAQQQRSLHPVLKVTLITIISVIGVVIALEVLFRVAVPVHPVEAMGWFWKVPDPVTGWSMVA